MSAVERASDLESIASKQVYGLVLTSRYLAVLNHITLGKRGHVYELELVPFFSFPSHSSANLFRQTVAQLTSLGFDSQRVISVLTKVNGDVERAVQVPEVLSFYDIV